MKARYLWEEAIFCALFSENISNIWDLVMSIWYEKTKSLWMDSITIKTSFRDIKKNWIVPWTTKEELAWVIAKHPNITDVMIDCTERPVKRDSDYKEQKKDFSWKKKRHTVKNLIVSTDRWFILWISNTEHWSKHDYRILQESEFMEHISRFVIWADTWFIWIKKDFPWSVVMMPKKNSKLHKLTEEEKIENKTISWIRIIIEHIIGHIKKYRIISHIYRNRTRGNYKTVVSNMKHMVIEIACWLYNLKYIST